MKWNWLRVAARIGQLAAFAPSPAVAQQEPGKLAIVCTAYTDVNRKAPTIYATASEVQAQPPERRLRQIVEESGARVIAANCWSALTEAEALNLQAREGHRMFAELRVPAGWYNGETPPRAAALPPPPKAGPVVTSSNGGYLTIKERPRPGPEAPARSVSESQRRAADARAKSAADLARANAEYQAKLAKFFAELRRRGRAQ